jgi:hypothetical protein
LGKPSAPDPPDYAAAARAQGQENTQSALASNFLNQVNQNGPDGSLTYSYDRDHGLTLKDGTVVPSVTATTVLSPEQQHLRDQNMQMSGSLNDLGIQGLGYVRNAVSTPLTGGNFNPLTSSVPTQFNANRDQVTQAMMSRLQPSIDRGQAAMEQKLANQGIAVGSDAYKASQDDFNRGVNDQRTSALLAGDQEEQNLFNRGLASSQFANSAQQQAIQEADYFRNQPLNMLNALRTGNQATLPQFGNVSGGANIAAAPVYQATADQYNAAMQNYQARLNSQNGFLSGLAGLGSAAILA